MTDERVKKIIDKTFHELDVLVREVQEEKRKEKEAAANRKNLKANCVNRKIEKTEV